MKRILFLSCLLYSILLGHAFAGGGNNVSSLTSAWGGGTANTCGNHGIEGSQACIGSSANNSCKAFTEKVRTKNGYGFLMMVARKVTQNGAYFCPTQVESDNRQEWRDAWTEYADATSGNEALCVWLCKSGYSGPTCNQSASSVTTCDSTTLFRDNYSNLKILSSGNNIEDSVAMFSFNNYVVCEKNKIRKEEHDMILAIKRWTASGHGAFVRQVVVRADAEKPYTGRKSSAVVYDAQNSSDILVCKNGYKPNANGTDCESIKAGLCPESTADKIAKLCPNWTDMDTAVHDFKLVNDCYQYRCIQPGYAFTSSANRTCEECSSDAKTGISPADGTCIRCEAGQIFNEDSATSGYCSEALAYSKTDLMYGKGKTKDSVKDIDEQCWTLLNPDEYKKCVTGSSLDSNTRSILNSIMEKSGFGTPKQIITDVPPVSEMLKTVNNSGGASQFQTVNLGTSTTSGSTPKVTTGANIGNLNQTTTSTLITAPQMFQM